MHKFTVILSLFCLAVIPGDVAVAASKKPPLCKSTYAKWQKVGNNRAFAVSKDGKKCGASGIAKVEKSPKGAERQALSGCRKVGGRGCKLLVSITYKNGRYHTKKNAIAAARNMPAECKKGLQRVRSNRRHFAFAVANNVRWCGYSTFHKSRKAAVNGAMGACRKGKNVKDCTLYETRQ